MSDQVGQGEERRRSYVAPILYRIVHGTSSTSLNLIEQRPKTATARRLFRKDALYSTIIFKYPNFSGAGPNRSPVETGLYVPHDPQAPMHGGYGIYLSRPGHRTAAKEFIGLDLDAADPDLAQDLSVLGVLNEIPSIDPFLVRSRLDYHHMSSGDGVISITDRELVALRQIVERRMAPILQRATRGSPLATSQVRRTLDAIWDSRHADSALFLSAFGVEPRETGKVLFALQGITYYEHVYQIAGRSAAGVGAWLKGPARTPEDFWRYPRYDQERLTMLRTDVARQIAAAYKYLAATFGEYDLALQQFVENDQPAPIQSFLRTAEARFWKLGFTLAAVLNVQTVVEAQSRSPVTARKFEVIQEALGQIRVMLEDRAAAHTI